MKKILLSLFTALMAVAVNAQEVTFDAKTDTCTSTITKDGVTITVSSGVLNNKSEYRLYKSSTTTITATDKNITKVEFTCTAEGTAKYGPGCFTTEVGSYTNEGAVGTWTGSASEVVFTASSNQVRATKIVVTLAAKQADAIDKPTFSLEAGKYTSAQELTITGPNGYGLIYTTDGTKPEDGVGTAVATNTATIAINATTTVKAIAVDNNDPDNASEVASATFTIIKEVGSIENPLTVKEANDFIAADKDLDSYVYTKGMVAKIKELSTSYGNATYWICNGTDTLEVYRGYGLNNVKFTAEDDLLVGDSVIVYGQLVNYKNTYEYTASNYIVYQKKVAREEKEPYVVTGAGTLENPYTTADVKALFADGTAPADPVWVKGTILGCVNTSTGATVTADTLLVASNISLGTADGNISVQLPTGAIRTAINVKDTPSNIGKEVYIYGKIQKYCNVAGLKSVTEYSWDGKASSIKAVATDAAAKTVKTVENGKIIINKNGKKYSTTGVRL